MVKLVLVSYPFRFRLVSSGLVFKSNAQSFFSLKNIDSQTQQSGLTSLPVTSRPLTGSVLALCHSPLEPEALLRFQLIFKLQDKKTTSLPFPFLCLSSGRITALLIKESLGAQRLNQANWQEK